MQPTQLKLLRFHHSYLNFSHSCEYRLARWSE